MLAIANHAIKLPRLTREDVERAKRLGTHRAAIVLPGAKGFSLEIGEHEDGGGNPAELVQIDAEMEGAPFSMTAPRQLVHELVQALGPSITLDDLPPDLGGLLLEASVASLLGLLEQSTDRPISVRAFQDLKAPPTGTPMILHGPDRHWQLHLSCDAPTLEAFLNPWPVAAQDIDWLPVPARMRFGLTTLDLTLLRSLRSGDVLLMETQLEQPSTLMLVVAESICAPAAFNGSAVQLLGPAGRNRKDWIMSAHDEDGGDDLNSLPVRLAFDLGHMDIPLGELRQLDAGVVLELGRKAQEFVEISANGRRIGRGELVEVDGMIGVKIASIFNA